MRFPLFGVAKVGGQLRELDKAVPPGIAVQGA
jgi:hypothetical protein